MNRYKELLTNSILFTIGNFGSKLITFVLVPFYTYYLTTQEFGTADIITTSIQLLLPLATLGAADSIIRFGMDKDYDQKKVFTNSMLITFCGLIAVSLAFITISSFIGVKKYILITILTLIMQAFQILVSTYVRSLGLIIVYTINSILYTLSICLFSLIFLLGLNWGVFGYFYAQILGAFMSILLLFTSGKLYRYFSLAVIDRSMISDILKFSVPLIPSGISWWVINGATRYIILIFVGAVGNGIFAVASKIPGLLTLIQGIFIQAWQMSAIQESKKEDKGVFYETVFSFYAKFLFTGISVFLLFLKPLIKLIFAPSYFESWILIPFLLLAAVYNSFSNFFGQIYIAEKETKGVFKTIVFAAVFCTFINILLVPSIGIIGASVAQFVGWFMTFLYRRYDTKKYVNFNIQVWNLLFCQLIIFLQILLLFQNVINEQFANVLLWVLALLILLINRELFFVCIKLMKRGGKRIE
ncbi:MULTISPECIES: lipopolysaccharide biosynthesis protein [unclassified Enterococcus]|uniref:lipopolysaccharide biosynthesis protein n=1 Tax=unclassified Enterococcus TaxID=2608891 RepID=UPI001CE1C9CC|nr:MULTISPECIES: oligosaccharide flippase family protein [unclassified Enterococcus]MCA5014100.1 oligosaccharide flippase family protein [Enterococcus sp. S23]MCA5017126.1 oligosaccharide flippase family protein [Enterococcus sp. S22(2020)]